MNVILWFWDREGCVRLIIKLQLFIHEEHNKQIRWYLQFPKWIILFCPFHRFLPDFFARNSRMEIFPDMCVCYTNQSINLYSFILKYAVCFHIFPHFATKFTLISIFNALKIVTWLWFLDDVSSCTDFYRPSYPPLSIIFDMSEHRLTNRQIWTLQGSNQEEEYKWIYEYALSKLPWGGKYWRKNGRSKMRGRVGGGG